MIPAAEYLARMEGIIRGILEELEQLPDGPERQEMERLLEEMRGIVGERLGENCNKKSNEL